jgi:HEAT repeat protein
LDSLVRALEIKDDRVLVSAIWPIANYLGKATVAVDALVHHTANPNREVRWRAVWALERIRPVGQHYAELFAKLFDDGDYLVRGYAVLGFIAVATPSPWAITQLQRAAQDVDDMPRIHAQRALEQWENDGRG